MRPSAHAFLVSSLVLAGCGLGLDFDPPDPDAGAGFDAAGFDAGDAQVARECEVPSDCDDGDPCTGPASCEAGRCVVGPTRDCDDGDPCNGFESCEGGECVTAPVSSCEDDGDPCNGREECVPFMGCTSVEPLRCDDGVACTIDSCGLDGCNHFADDTMCALAAGGACDPVLDCQYPSCVVGVTCIAAECGTARCDGDTCVPDRLCDAGEGCCAGACVAMGCDDGDPCTADTCGPSGCLHTPISSAAGGCSDGDPCTTGDHCDVGACVSVGRRPCSDLDPCTADSCNSSTALCEHRPLSPTESCGRNALCDTVGACVCVGGFRDCTGDGNCDCVGSCTGGVCGVTSTDCITGPACIGTLACCTAAGNPFFGMCGGPSCGGGTPAGCCPPTS